MRASLSPNPADEPLARPERLIAIDIARFFAFLAILVYHATFALWAPRGLTSVPAQHWSGHALEHGARALAFSGFAVLFFSFFLYGFRDSRKTGLPLWLLGFAAVWAVSVQQWPYWWDVYPFLLVALAVLKPIRRLRYPEYAVVGAATLLSIPFWRLEPVLQMPLAVQSALTGVCQSRTDLGDWPLLPWIAYPVFAFGLGRLACHHRDRLARLHPAELTVWIAALLAASPWLNKYYVTNLGEQFGCFMFRQPPLHFWAQNIPLLFLVRLSFIARVQNRLAASPIAAWFSRRFTNRSFFIAYFLHYPLVHAVAALLEARGLSLHPFALTATVLSVLLALEAGPVVFRAGLKHNRWGEFIWPRISAR